VSYETLLLEKSDAVATIKFNRPEKKNVMNPKLHEEMTELLETLRYDDSVRVIVLTGTGDSFCAGMDFKEFLVGLKDNPAEFDRIERLAREWRGRTLKYFPKPTIAMVNGFCFGGAFAQLEACDLAIAADEATFGLSEINFKMFPAGAVTKALANALRPRDALYYALTGKPFGGKVAREIGLVNFSVPAPELHKATYELAVELASKDPIALAAAKEVYRFSVDMGWDASQSYAMAKFAEVGSAQGDRWRSEGIGKFLEGEYRPGLGANAS
jgi:feruloyl-CoA hydratase/lyase